MVTEHVRHSRLRSRPTLYAGIDIDAVSLSTLVALLFHNEWHPLQVRRASSTAAQQQQQSFKQQQQHSSSTMRHAHARAAAARSRVIWANMCMLVLAR